MELDPAVRERFDAILGSVKEPQSELSLAELGLVEKMTYFAKEETIVVYMNFAPHNPSECPACYAAADLMKDSIERDLKEALLEAFPGWTVEFA